jgi:hypothetical protein
MKRSELYGQIALSKDKYFITMPTMDPHSESPELNDHKVLHIQVSQ